MSEPGLDSRSSDSKGHHTAVSCPGKERQPVTLPFPQLPLPCQTNYNCVKTMILKQFLKTPFLHKENKSLSRTDVKIKWQSRVKQMSLCPPGLGTCSGGPRPAAETALFLGPSGITSAFSSSPWVRHILLRRGPTMDRLSPGFSLITPQAEWHGLPHNGHSKVTLFPLFKQCI